MHTNLGCILILLLRKVCRLSALPVAEIFPVDLTAYLEGMASHVLAANNQSFVFVTCVAVPTVALLADMPVVKMLYLQLLALA